MKKIIVTLLLAALVLAAMKHRMIQTHRRNGKQMGQHIKGHSHMAEQHDCVLIMLLRAI